MFFIFFLLLFAAAAASPGKCDLCARRFVIILSAGGRTGSTTLLYMLNELPHVYLTGEHDGILYTLRETQKHFDAVARHSDTGAWLHPSKYVEDVNFYCWVQEWFEYQSSAIEWGKDGVGRSNSSDVYGFKEIRYTDPDILKFIVRLFPCAKFIINTRRDSVDQAMSQNKAWRAKTNVDISVNENGGAKLETGAQKLLEFFPISKANVFHFQTEEYDNLDKWNALITFIDAPKTKNCKFSHVLHENDAGGYKLEKTNKGIVTNC